MTAVIFTILPVFAVVFAGFLLARVRLISSEGLKGFTNVTFYLFVPALLFRAMLGVHLGSLDLRPVYGYFTGALLCFLATMIASRRWIGQSARHATVTALAVTFSNTVLLGIPLVKLAFGDAGLVILLTIISMHSLILYSTATLFLEFGLAGGDGAAQSHWANVWEAARNTLISPVIMPIVAGLFWGALGWPVPDVVDAPLVLLGSASAPCSLVLLGASLAQYGIAEYWRPAAVLSVLKNALYPLFMWALGHYAFGLAGTALAVVTLTAALPMGANVFLFAQRYEVAQGQITAAVALSTGASVLTLTLVLLLFG